MKTLETYQEPAVEVTEVEVETGFAATGGTTDTPGGNAGDDVTIE